MILLEESTFSDALQRMDHVLSSPPPPVSRAISLAAHEAEEAATENVGEDVVHARATPTSFP